jgi:ribonuclease HI
MSVVANKTNYIFTDASLIKKAGIGIYYSAAHIQTPVKKHYYIDGKKDINRAELSAIYAGLLLYPTTPLASLASHTPHTPLAQLDLFSDSITAINLIEDKTYNKKFNTLVQCIRYVSSKKYKNSKLIYTKVKAHSGIKENDIAHYLARCGARSATGDANPQIFHIPDAVIDSNSNSNSNIEELVLENIYKNSLLHSDIYFS